MCRRALLGCNVGDGKCTGSSLGSPLRRGAACRSSSCHISARTLQWLSMTSVCRCGGGQSRKEPLTCEATLPAVWSFPESPSSCNLQCAVCERALLFYNHTAIARGSFCVAPACQPSWHSSRPPSSGSHTPSRLPSCSLSRQSLSTSTRLLANAPPSSLLSASSLSCPSWPPSCCYPSM